MRISGKKSVGADLQALLSKPMFTSNDDDADLEYLSTQPNANPIYENIVYGAREEWKVSDVMVNTLVDLADPRLEVYVALNDEDEYRGKPVGIANVPNEEYNYNNVSGLGEFYLESTREAFLMSYSELEFLMAEAAERGLITGGGSAADHYNAGIVASMEYNGVEEYEGYLASVEYESADWEELIGTQKWLALYGQGLEAWTEWRRTKIPVLSLAVDAYNTTMPSRLSYPATEQTTNRVNYQANVAAQGADIYYTKIWWME